VREGPRGAWAGKRFIELPTDDPCGRRTATYSVAPLLYRRREKEEETTPRRAEPHRLVTPDTLPGILRLWVLRLLVPLGGSSKFVGRDASSNSGLANALRLDLEAPSGG